MTQYVGIGDAHGLESFISVPEQILEAELTGQNGNRVVNKLQNVLSMRAQANRHRHAVIYRVEVDEADAAAIKWLMDGERYADALIKLKQCAKEVEVGKGLGMKKSWGLIPDEKLDPYSD